MIAKETIEQIINLAISAPSGDNCQPWSFEVINDEIKIFNLPDRDQSIYNRGQRGALVAHGALLESLKIASSHFGLNAEISFPGNETNLIFSIKLNSAPSINEDPLLGFLTKRTTNRKPYKKNSLDGNLLPTLKNLENEYSPIQINWATEQEKIKALAESASYNERLLFENKSMHDFFFSHINWTKDEEEKKRLGFFIETLELPPPAKVMFKLAKDWSKLKFLNKLGLSKMVGKANSAAYSACGAIIAITSPDLSAQNLIRTGRFLQRCWLTIASRGLYAQPMTGMVLINHAIEKNEAEELKQEEVDAVKNHYAGLKQTLGINGRDIIMMLRIGQSAPPSAQASRLQPKIIWKT